MKEINEAQLKDEIDEIAKRIKKIMKKVATLDPTPKEESEEDPAELNSHSHEPSILTNTKHFEEASWH